MLDHDMKAFEMSFGTGPPLLLSWLPYMSTVFLPLAIVYGFASTTDVILLFSLVLFQNWKAAYRILQFYDLHLDFLKSCGVVVLLAAAQIIRWLTRRSVTDVKSDAGGPKALFFPSRTTHTRFFPKIHSFSYSYLLVGIPVGWQGSAGGMLSADQRTHGNGSGSSGRDSSRSWYTVDAGDYLDRGYGQLGLDGKLRKFIQSQGLRPDDYPYAYLVTAPKFLGYSFNPVSFWYLYSNTRELTAMILEVNNTFDERHPYFLKPSQDSLREVSDTQVENTTSEDCLEVSTTFAAPRVTDLAKKPTRFTNSWAKEFHVSPFNSRKGTYSLAAYDPLYPHMSGRGSIDNSITLKSSKAHPKLVARIFSEGVPINPQIMSTRQKWQFLISWWWVGLVTFPRIVREAWKLFFRRKLHVWFRPEPLKTSLGRHADTTEKVLEAYFRTYLKHLVKSATSPIVLNYTATGIPDFSTEKMMSEAAKENGQECKVLEFSVLTPVFYSRFVHYAHDLEAFFSEFHESGTIWLSEPSLLPDLVLRKPRPPQSMPNLTNYVAFKVIQSLRQRPAPIEGPKTTQEWSKPNIFDKKSDIRTFRLSAMDGYFLAHGTPVERNGYRKTVLKLFISDRVALGNVGLLWAEAFILKCLAAWFLARRFPLS